VSAAALRFVAGPKSPLPGVTDAQWFRLTAALEVQPIGAVSDSGGLGAYDIRPRRLVELKLATKLRYVQAPSGRWIHVCSFVPPMTGERFLSDLSVQSDVLSRSISVYYSALMGGELTRPSEECSVAGALSILHRGGTGALKAFPDLFDDTRSLYSAAKEIF
jgi:hypothetical protein